MSVLQSLVFPPGERAADRALYLARELSESKARVTPSSLTIAPGAHVSLLSYFNAFPASYWQHATNVERVQLIASTAGEGTIALWASDAAGRARVVEERAVTGTTTTTLAAELGEFDEGGWLWLELAAGGGELTLSEAQWTTDASPTQPGLLLLGMTTMNKPDFAVATLRAIAAHPALAAELDQVLVVDQGTRLVSDEPGYAEVRDELGELLRIIRQPNLGGSGGFARVMAEAVERPAASAVMLLDDDVEVEPEGILRALRFHRHARTPTLVGGHMFDLTRRTVLHAWSEVVDDDVFNWGPPDPEHRRWDLAARPIAESPWLHRREQGDFNGWFMCLIPTAVVRAIGLALPVFIKWDDAEYGLRAKAAGFPTVTLPGAALWHLSWLDKDDSIDWQAYFHARNRTIAALLHSDRPAGGALLADSRRQDLKHLLSMQYYAVTLRHRALADVLAGPGVLHAALATSLQWPRAAAAEFSETEKLPLPARAAATSAPPAPAPHGAALALATLRWVARQLIIPVRASARRQPQPVLSKQQATWWRLPRLDSAIVITADGSGANRYTRDRARFRRQLRDSIRLHRRLAREWESLRARYRAALPELVSAESWRQHFEDPEHAG
ncbi:glycosyltransferase [Gryllotalpicola kribbensis]|uniref:Glycosyltransferase n=1 Tax=Gryllotalpicola kribbensis TaxID=993084 RepID=A0ABP8AMR8_9MICO